MNNNISIMQAEKSPFAHEAAFNDFLEQHGFLIACRNLEITNSTKTLSEIDAIGSFKGNSYILEYKKRIVDDRGGVAAAFIGGARQTKTALKIMNKVPPYCFKRAMLLIKLHFDDAIVWRVKTTGNTGDPQVRPIFKWAYCVQKKDGTQYMSKKEFMTTKYGQKLQGVMDNELKRKAG